MGAITKAAYESNGDSQQRQICCVVIAIKGLAKRVWQKWVGLILGQDFVCLSSFKSPRQTKNRLQKQQSTWRQLMYYTHNFVLCFY
jgi:hypothetical protein